MKTWFDRGRLGAKVTARYVKTIGLKTNQPRGRGFLYPYDVAFASDGQIYALNRGRVSQGLGTRIQMFTYDEEWLGEFGEGKGTGPSNFQLPVSMAFNSKDLLHISDEGLGEIKIFDRVGNPVAQLGKDRVEGGSLKAPTGLAIDSDDNLYVVERDSNRVHKLTPDGETILTWGEEGDGEGQFDMPWGVAIDSEGFVYVADWRNDRIQKFTPEGEFCASFGESGTGEGQFHRPSSVAVDARGTIYITDWGNERVQVLGPDGEFKQMLRGEATLSKWAEQWLDVNRDELSARNGSDLRIEHLPQHLRTPYQIGAQTEHLFWGPVSAKLDGEHRLYVSEHSRARIQIYATN